MSSKYDTEPKENVFATYKNDTVKLIEKLPLYQDIWLVENIETESLSLAYEDDLENPYYYGD